MQPMWELVQELGQHSCLCVRLQRYWCRQDSVSKALQLDCMSREELEKGSIQCMPSVWGPIDNLRQDCYGNKQYITLIINNTFGLWVVPVLTY